MRTASGLAGRPGACSVEASQRSAAQDHCGTGAWARARTSASRLTLAGLFLLAGCLVQLPPPPTPLELQTLQSRDYDQDRQVVFGSVMSVFQDLGYTPTSADIETGFITAESAATGDFDWIGILTDTSNTVQTRATAYIEEVGEGVRVRLSFVEVRSISSDQGQASRNDRALLDPSLYDNAFERIEQAIFVRSGE